MAVAKKRGAPKLSAEERAAQRQAIRAAKKKVNREKLDAAKAELTPLAKEILGAPINKGGRPATHITVAEMTEAQVQYFEEQIGLGVLVKQICAERDDFPSEYAIWKAIAQEDSVVAKSYARGKQVYVANAEERILAIANTTHLGKIVVRRQVVTKDGDVVDTVEEREADMLGHRQLMVDTLKWQLSHIRPKKHGRNPEDGGGGKNEQLESLFQALMKGPKDGDT